MSPSVPHNWMTRLAAHYETQRRLYPNDRLLVLFDIDGTILDMRHMVLHVLRAFDSQHQTSFFDSLSLDAITVHENHVERLLEDLGLDCETAAKVLDWYTTQRWSPEAVLHAHHPYRGVMEVIRWFQLQPKTHVGLNTGRPESIREWTLQSLNALGEMYRVSFADDLLFMNPGQWHQGVENAKAAAVENAQEQGFRVLAVVDNEPDNLTAIAHVEGAKEILLLHADTLFESSRGALPKQASIGKAYDLTELIKEDALPKHVQFVWHGLNDDANVREFMASNIQWAEIDLRRDPGGRLIVHGDAISPDGVRPPEALAFCDVLEQLEGSARSVKIDFKERDLVDPVCEAVQALGFTPERLWFNANVEVLGEAGYRTLAERFEGAIIQCPIGFMVPLLEAMPDTAEEILQRLETWGVNRLSIDWKTPNLPQRLEQLQRLGYQVNIYNVPDLETFLRAVLYLPTSITSHFNFPKWHYHGHGPRPGAPETDSSSADSTASSLLHH